MKKQEDGSPHVVVARGLSLTKLHLPRVLIVAPVGNGRTIDLRGV